MISNLFKAVVSVALTPVAIAKDIVTLPVSAESCKDAFNTTSDLLKNAGECIQEAIKPDKD